MHTDTAASDLEVGDFGCVGVWQYCGCCQSPDDDPALVDGGGNLRFPLRYSREVGCIGDAQVTMGLQLSLAVLAFQVTSGSLAPLEGV